jgi:peptidoglycan/xylan/chitin deacetylase (PgdA/CDA1 family)
VDNQLYTYQPIIERAPLTLPNRKKLAFYVGLNIEHFHVDVPSRSLVAPDPMSQGQRDYGTRVGIWRLIDLFDELGLRASAITNSEVCTHYPQIVSAGVARDWAWIAHGQTNSKTESGMPVEEEKAYLKEMIATLDALLPARPKGWLGPGLSETFDTPGLLREYGFTYLLDWCCDDQPFAFAKHELVSVPYSLEVNDIGMWGKSLLTGPDYEGMVLDQFEVLLEDAQKTGMVMALPIHTFVVGQPHLFKYLRRVLREICNHPDVWVCTSDDIAAHYLELLGV